MDVIQLPDYSAERYYLLSEIEQKANYVLLDEVDLKEGESLNVSHPVIFYYVRWKPQEEKVKSVVAKVQALQRQVPVGTQQTVSEDQTPLGSSVIVVIEAYINNKDAWNADMESQVSMLMEGSQAHFGSNYLIVGITDCIGGTPALEKCHDLIESLLPGYEHMTIFADFVANQRVDMLGLDPNSEPDAQSEVFQLLCLPKDDVLTTQEDLLREKVHLFIAEQGSQNTGVTPDPSQLTLSLVMVSVFAVFLAYLAKQSNLL